MPDTPSRVCSERNGTKGEPREKAGKMLHDMFPPMKPSAHTIAMPTQYTIVESSEVSAPSMA